MKLPTSADYKAYRKGLISQREYERRSAHSTIATATVGIGVNVIALINPALGIVVGVGSVLACAIEDYVASPARLKKQTDIVVEDLEVIRKLGKSGRCLAELKGERCVEISREQFDSLLELREEFNLSYRVIY